MCVDCNLSEEFTVKEGVHQGSCLSPYCSSSQFWKPKSFLQDVPGKTCMQMTWWSSLNHWRNWMRSWSSGRLTWKERDFRSSWAKPRSWYLGLDVLKRSSKNLCAMCLKGISTNSIFCGGCSTRNAVLFLALWSLIRCKQCTGQARPVYGRPMTEVTVGQEKLQVVPPFCYLRDCLSSGGHCELASITTCHVAWDKFNELLPVLTSHVFPIASRWIWRIYIHQERHAPSKWNPGPNLIWFVSPAMQWPSYDLLDVQCHHQGPSQLTRSSGGDAA